MLDGIKPDKEIQYISQKSTVKQRKKADGENGANDIVEIKGKREAEADSWAALRSLKKAAVQDKAVPAALEDIKKMTKAQLQKYLRDTIHRMTAIARTLGGDHRMDIKEGKNWAYSFDSNTITYPLNDLIEKHPDYALGVILHELSHRRYSKWLVEGDMKDNEPFIWLLNAVEDPRVNNVLTSRYEGVGDFFKKVYDADLFTDDFNSDVKNKLTDLLKKNGLSDKQAKETVEKMASPVPRAIQFGLGIIYDWYTGGKIDPRIKDPQVKEALKEAAPFFREAIKLKRDVMFKDLTGAEILQQAQDAYKITKEKIWPIYQKLVEQDKKDLTRQLQQQSGQSGQSGQAGQSGQSDQSGQSGKSGEQKGTQNGQSGNSGKTSQSGQRQQPSRKGDANGGTIDDKDDKDATGGGGMNPDRAKEIAGKVIDELTKELSDSKLEEKGKDARRENRDGGDGNGKEKSGQVGQQQGASQSKQGQQGQHGQSDNGQQGQQQGNSRQGGSNDINQGQPGQNQQDGSSQGGATSEIDLPTLEELLKMKMELEQRNENRRSSYDKYVYDTAEFSSELSGELKNVMHEHERPKFTGPFRTGKKLNLKRAMQSEAKYEITGEFDDEIWDRRTRPTKIDHLFVFVLDESGSMRDSNKWENAKKGLVLCQEALDELDINFGVVGFSDTPQIHKNLEDKFDESFRDNEMNSIDASPSGGTNDADAVQVALEMLRIQDPQKQKTVIVITDGEGKKEEMKKLVGEAEEAGIKIIGVGIGDGTEAVEDVFKYKVKVNNLAQLPAKLAEIIREQIESAYE